MLEAEGIEGIKKIEVRNLNMVHETAETMRSRREPDIIFNPGGETAKPQ